MIVSLPEMLDARERRANRQRELLEKYRKPLVSFTMNIAGPIKDSPLIRRGFDMGLRDLEQVLSVDRIPILHKEVIREYTGSEAIVVVDAPAKAGSWRKIRPSAACMIWMCCPQTGKSSSGRLPGGV